MANGRMEFVPNRHCIGQSWSPFSCNMRDSFSSNWLETWQPGGLRFIVILRIEPNSSDLSARWTYQPTGLRNRMTQLMLMCRISFKHAIAQRGGCEKWDMPKINTVLYSLRAKQFQVQMNWLTSKASFLDIWAARFWVCALSVFLTVGHWGLSQIMTIIIIQCSLNVLDVYQQKSWKRKMGFLNRHVNIDLEQ